MASTGAQELRAWLESLRNYRPAGTLARDVPHLLTSGKYASILLSAAALLERSAAPRGGQQQQQRYFLTALKGPLPKAELEACQRALEPLGLYLASADDFTFAVCRPPGQRKRFAVVVRAFPQAVNPLDHRYWTKCNHPSSMGPTSLVLATFPLEFGFESVDRSPEDRDGGFSFFPFVQTTVRPTSSKWYQPAPLNLPVHYQAPSWDPVAYARKAEWALARFLLARQADALLARLPAGLLEGASLEHCQVMSGYVCQGVDVCFK